MSAARIAIGVGCRRGASGEAIAALVRQAIAASRRSAGAGGAGTLYSIEDKCDERGLHAAAADLQLDLVFLPRAALQAAAPRTTIRSPVAAARFGVSSVAEAAALAGAGPRSSLVVPRLTQDGVTCAVAAVPTP